MVRLVAGLVLTGVLAAACTGPDADPPDVGPATSQAPQARTCETPGTVHDPRDAAGEWSVQDLLGDATRSVSGGVVVALGPTGAVHLCAAGRADTAGTALRTDDVFRVGSLSKTFATVLVMQLVEEGRLALEDDVTTLLPGLELPDGITVRQLLNHTSGLPDYLDASFDLAVREDWDRTWTPTQVLTRVLEKEQELGRPGTEHRYSNTNFLVVGLLVEAVTGRPYADNLRSRITEPLGMGSTGLGQDGPAPVTGFSPVLPGGSTESVSYRALETAAGAAGGIVSTAPDLVQFATALADGRLVAAESFAEMTAFVEVGDAQGIGLGLFQDRAGRVGHDGEVYGFRSLMMLPSGPGELLVVLSNDAYVNVHTLAEGILSGS